ncbi:hypothetical protein LSH36_67g03032 [Paralvinella palmiformis]|uniref:Uncharacterized protein n=1 Tax=Paralvinella palmiformis TaxID=53620 RepID=A0AAD9NBK0_9ANNE|nr:hypothetical protein LSH36_67g03032 [Paralvinella palmiformis]
MAVIWSGSSHKPMPSWTLYDQKASTVNPEKTTVDFSIPRKSSLQRDGSWDLHLYVFKRMLPFLSRYDHVNCARWGTVYLAEITVVALKQRGVFQDGGDTLRNIINKDVVTTVVQESLLSAEHVGQAQMNVLVDKRPLAMATSDTSNTSVIDFDGLVVRPVVVGLRDEWASEYSALLDDEWPDFLTRHATINMDILIVDNLNFDPDAKDDIG